MEKKNTMNLLIYNKLENLNTFFQEKNQRIKIIHLYIH